MHLKEDYHSISTCPLNQRNMASKSGLWQIRAMATCQIFLFTTDKRHRIQDLGYDIMMKMVIFFFLFFDNFFSNSFLFDCLLAQNTYACGTVHCNRKDLPSCAKQKLKQGEIVTAQRDPLVFTKWHDK